MRVASFPGSSLVFSLWQVARHSLGGFSKPTLLSRLILESLKPLFSVPHDSIKYNSVTVRIDVYYSGFISIHIIYTSCIVHCELDNRNGHLFPCSLFVGLQSICFTLLLGIIRRKGSVSCVCVSEREQETERQREHTIHGQLSRPPV